MAYQIFMPKQGNTVETCVINRWNKKEGDTIAIQETLCEIETDKATMTVESTAKGTILKLLYEEGDDVPVQTAIAIIGESGEDISDLPHETIGETIDESHNAIPETRDEFTAEPQGEQASSYPSRIQTKPENAVPLNTIAISPVAKNLAESMSITYSTIQGTGPHDRIIKRDIQAIIDAKKSVPNTTQVQQEQTPYTYTLRGIRKITARRMRESLETTAQLTLHRSIAAEKIVRLHELLKSQKTEYEVPISFNDLMLYVVSRTILQSPKINAHLKDNTITEFPYVNVGCAVNTSHGLFVPVIKNAHTLSIVEIAKEVRRLSSKCHDGSITIEELQGGTFTVSNLGSTGVEYFTPILNTPETSLLGIGTIRLQAIYDEKSEMKMTPHICLSFSFDHQAFDGMYAAQFLQNISSNIENLSILLYNDIVHISHSIKE